MEDYEATIIEIRNFIGELEQFIESISDEHIRATLINSLSEMRSKVNRLEAEIDNAIEEQIEMLMDKIRKQ